MGFKEKLFHLVGKFLLERPGHKRTLAELTEELETSGRTAMERLATAADNPKNRQNLRHVIGIERWGQRRLKVALGEPFVMDKSDAYFPAADIGWDELRETFRTTREETVALARELQQAGVDPDLKVRHNQWGALSVQGWLYYLNFHANGDLKKMK